MHPEQELFHPDNPLLKAQIPHGIFDLIQSYYQEPAKIEKKRTNVMIPSDTQILCKQTVISAAESRS